MPPIQSLSEFCSNLPNLRTWVRFPSPLQKPHDCIGLARLSCFKNPLEMDGFGRQTDAPLDLIGRRVNENFLIEVTLPTRERKAEKWRLRCIVAAA
jgi:hypothetical protein